MVKEHYFWIDWMKVIGMYFIIVGHIAPLLHQTIYVFSVPLFFFISGFLSHKETTQKLFWDKLWHNLILPLLLFSVILHFINIGISGLVGNFHVDYIPVHMWNCLIGNQGNHSLEGGLGVCWFIYTLIVCKLITQYVSQNKLLNFVFIVLCLLFALWYNINEMNWYNSIANTSLAYPMYAVGGGIKV